MKDVHITFATNLKNFRKKEGFTRTQLAEIISYSEKSIEKWEMGSTVPPVSTICTLADVFGVTVDALLFPHNTEIKYLLGVDGGGTKTEFLLTDLEGKEIRRLQLGASNPVDIGIDATKKVLESGFTQICKNLNRGDMSVFVGIAGSSSGNYQQKINVFLSKLGFGYYSNGSDTENAIETALKGENGVVVIMGTGHAAFAQANGKRHRVAGWGYLIDRGGSGYNLGADALYTAFKSYDGRGGSDLLLKLIEETLDKPLPNAVPEIYSGCKRFIASFAPLVFEAYKQGDKYAEEIIDNNVRETVHVILTAQKSLKGAENKTVLCGSLCRQEAVLRPFFAKYLGEDHPLFFSTEPPVNGALSLAKSNIKNSGGN